MIEIPKQLQKEQLRFFPLVKENKMTLAGWKDWQNKKNFKYDDFRLTNHLKAKGNYGVIGGFGNLIIIDADSEEISNICETLPETFTVKSGSDNNYKKHYYFITEEKFNPVRFSKEKIGDLGDIRSVGQYVVGPNCIHPSGGQYKIIKDIEITKITKEDLMKVFKNYDIEKRFDNNESQEIKINTTKGLNKFYRNCKVPDYLLNNKLKNNSSKNWKLFPMIIDILVRREVSPELFQKLCKTQHHDYNAITGWIDYAKKGTLVKKGSCEKMHEYLKFYSPEEVDNICGNCPLYKKHQLKDKLESEIEEKEIEKELSDYEKDKLELQKHLIVSISNKDNNQTSELVSNFVLKHNYIYTTKDDKASEIWFYNEGVYIPNGKCEIKELTRKLVGSFLTTHLLNQIILKIETDTYIESEEFFKQNTENKAEIPVRNGILNVIEKKLYPFTHEKIFFNKLPVIFNPDAKCDKIEEFLNTVLASEEDKTVFYEIAGFSLYKEYFLEKAIMFIGAGRNGKSKVISLLENLLGKENCEGLCLSSLTPENFSVSDLFGKLLNSAGDLSQVALKETGFFKSLTGRDKISAKRKFLNNIIFYNYAKMVFSCNKLPKVYDDSDGFWDRWLLIDFPWKFEPQSVYNKLSDEEKSKTKIQDPYIIEKIVSEKQLSGLLNQALEGLGRIYKNKEFSSTKTTKEIKEKWIRQSDSFTAFCMDFLEEDYDNYIIKKDLRKMYNKYCKKHRVQSQSDMVIKLRLQSMFGVGEEYKNDVKGVQQYSWSGIKLK